MLEVHPAHHAATTWRDFLIHIATLVLGLLIAIGLEQSVEALHHSHQRRELRESLHRESERILEETAGDGRASVSRARWLDQRIAQLRQALAVHRPPPPATPPDTPNSNIPDDHTWRAAEASGLAPLLTQDEVNAYMEIDTAINQRDSALADARTALKALRQFEGSLDLGNSNGQPDFLHMSSEDLHKDLTLLIAERDALSSYQYDCKVLRGAVTAVLAGQFAFGQIEASEWKAIEQH